MDLQSPAIDHLSLVLSRIKGRTWEKRIWLDFFRERAEWDESGCVLWTRRCDKLGYGRVNGRVDGEIRAHRISFAILNGPIPSGMKVLHRCDVRHCVNPFHLFMGTQAENVADMMAKGRHRCVAMPGTANGAAKIDDHIVRSIRSAIADGGRNQARIAKDFGVSPMTVSRIKHRQLWGHVS